MARITRFSVNFPLILPTLLGLVVAGVFATEPRKSTDEAAEIASEQLLCNFDEDRRTYNASDLLLCMNEMATYILLQQNTNQNRITDRAYQDSRQYLAYPSAPYYPISSGDAASSNYYTDQMLTSLLSGGLPLPNLSNLFNLGSFTRPGFNFFGALSSIAQYDDLKCVPRILCEVASGSMPGNLAYRQSSTFQDFGKNALFGLLTAFDVSGTSPILSFGKAALLGYTNRGQSNACYREYSRCPRNQDQLISYLNNHNGGFFRFFNGIGGNYYRPQQSSYKPYYKNNALESRIVQSKISYPSVQSFLGPEADRTGTGKLSFANYDYYGQQNSDATFFPTELKESHNRKVVFPKEKRENHFQSVRVIKSLNFFNDLTSDTAQKESLQKEHRFFPQEDENQNSDIEYTNQIDSNRKPRTEVFNHKERYVYFPHDSVHKDTSTFIFPNNLREY